MMSSAPSSSTPIASSPPSPQVSANSSHSTTQNQTQTKWSDAVNRANQNQTQTKWSDAEMKNQILPLLELIEGGNFPLIKKEFSTIPKESLGREINPSRETFLHVVIETGNVELVKYLVGLMDKKHLKQKDMHGDHPLVFAARVGEVAIAEAILVGDGGELPSLPNDDGLLPVTIAVQIGNERMADYLLKKTPLTCYSSSLAVAAISSDMHHIALSVLRNPQILTFPPGGLERNVLSVLAEKPTAFRSGLHFGVFDALLYEVLWAPKKPQSLVGNNNTNDQHRCIGGLFVGCGGCIDNSWYKFKGHPWVIPIVKVFEAINFWSMIEFVIDYKKLRAQKFMHLRVLDILQIIKVELSSLDETEKKEFGVYKSILKASENGIIELVSELVKCCPAWKSDGATIFENALLQRRELVFNLLHEYKYRKLINIPCDASLNNFLHAAGSEPPSSQRNRISGSALLLQRELQWFEAAEKLVPPQFKEQRNKDKHTPRELFTVNHKDIQKQGEKWMKETSRACMVVATLIATVVFTAAFTLPGGQIEKSGIPVFQKKWLFKLFILSDALSLFSSLTSMLMFLAILTSRFAEDDFLLALPRKMIFGLLSLFLSIVFMITAFCLTVFMIFPKTTIWVPWLSVGLAFFPVVLYISLHFRLLVDMIWATYGQSIFGKKVSFLEGALNWIGWAIRLFMALVFVTVLGVLIPKLASKYDV